ncbi:class I SAM-dependent methyltransferase [Parabacteroides bouchesdurhonensis]|uniref:class I SAM-dependent methyltransferase n=1 Tax=Parabacteroides bouchesdurhonensis TaxID=1936995 RepID=UPI000C856A6A|nr:methyltransferase domain-containing protein [Parabacteroides bouchesdurhonensis]
MSQKFTYLKEHRRTLDGEKILPIIMDIIKPKSVVDVGCGSGTFLHYFKQQNIEILGLDGSWCNREMLFENIEPSDFLEIDLENDFNLERRFDLAISLEVAEHISPERADNFVKNLTTLSDCILFSAAVPGQGGDHHVNEQYVSYWIEKFGKHGYVFYDIIRPKIWNETDVFGWYKQNSFLVTKKEFISSKYKFFYGYNVIHPDIFQAKVSELNNILEGKRGISFYVNLLMKYFSYKFVRKK